MRFIEFLQAESSSPELDAYSYGVVSSYGKTKPEFDGLKPEMALESLGMGRESESGRALLPRLPVQ